MTPAGEMHTRPPASNLGRTIELIPPELIDDVIDYYRNDKTALATFSLVSKGWLPRSRTHLFRNIELGEIKEGNEEAFFSLLDSPLSTILPFVRNLEFYVCDEPWMTDGVLRMRRLEAVQQLILCGSWESSPRVAQEPLRTSFQQLTLLKVDQILFDTFVDFIDLVCAYPLLEGLVIVSSAGWIDPRQPHPSSIRRLPARLHTLKCYIVPWTNHAVGSLFIWLQSQGQAPPIRVLALSPVIPSDIAPIGQYLRASGSAIHVLELRFPSWGGEGEEFFRHIDLGHNTGLRSFSLFSGGTYQLNMTGVVISLSQIKSNHLEEIRFSLPVGETKRMDGYDWKSLERVLERPQFSRLRKIHISFWGLTTLFRDAEAYIRRRWQAHNTRGTLTFPD